MTDKIQNEYHWDNPYTCAHGYLLDTIIEVLIQNDISPNSKILDVGCGGGYLLNELYKKGYENIWGFDLSNSGIEVCRDNFPDLSERFQVHNAYENELPKEFPLKKYDLIISSEVIEHLYDPQKYLENINSWLCEGGYVLLTTPYHGYLKNIAIAVSNSFDLHVDPLWKGGHIKFFSRSKLYQLLHLTEFKPRNFKGCGRLPYLWKSMVVISKKVKDCQSQ